MTRSLTASVLLVLMTLPSPRAGAQECGWARIAAPDPGPVVELDDVVGISDSDVWAVGNFIDGAEFSYPKTLAIHWDGKEWTAVETPTVSESHEHQLTAASASGPHDVWAVGTKWQFFEHGSSRGLEEPLVMHWNGEVWELIEMPPPSHSRGTMLTDVVARAPDDIWVSGVRRSRQNIEKSLVAHFDGSQWRRVSSGNKPGQWRTLSAVTATTESVWFVGTRRFADAKASHAFSIRYRTGTRQTSRMPSPPQAQAAHPTGLAAASETDVWTVGSYWVPNSSEIFARRFDGIRWRKAPTPQVGSGGINDFKGLTGLDAVDPTDVWATGYQTSRPDGSFRTDGFVARWDGAAWNVESFPQDSSATLDGIDMLSADDGWAVGTLHLDHSDSEPSFAPPSDGLIVRYVCE